MVGRGELSALFEDEDQAGSERSFTLSGEGKSCFTSCDF
jgi:hypothetical protein